MTEQGRISVSTENIFPIIKRSLYSDHEIFLRELVSNAVDATQKMKVLSSKGDFTGELGELRIRIALDKEAKTLTIKDAGIGLTAEEVKKYINVVAFSGAEEFVKKFKDVADTQDIIGKFGLGFYSAFMVASQVEIVSQSYQEGSLPVRWTCDGSTSYSLEELEAGAREGRGTDIILHIADDSEEFLESARISTILNKYCRFLPIEIEFEEKVINNPNPIWRKAPADLTDEDYKTFFQELYPFAEEPLFHIHLNVDHPFNLTGILYFPKIKKDIDPRRNQIQLYSRQVFITDEVKDIVPEYLMLLQGVIDSPDIPLNVSRSYLQGDSNVRKIANYITRKVADKLNEIYREDAAAFEQKWRDLSVFVKYGMITDDTFRDRAKKFALVENTDGKFFTFDEYKTHIAAKQTDKSGDTIWLYTTDAKQQDVYVQAAKSKGYDVLLMDGVLDSHFIGMLEREVEKSRFKRVDADTLDKLVEVEGEETAHTLTEDEQKALQTLFEGVRPEPTMQIKLVRMGAEGLPALIVRNEFMRRMKEMQATGGGQAWFGDMPETLELVLNTDHAAVAALVAAASEDKARQIVDLALLSQGMLQGAALTAFIRRSAETLA